jgi:hypothetical protein
MGVIKRGVFKNKGSGKGHLWESSRTPLHLAYACDPKDPLRTLETMRLKFPLRDTPSLRGIYHGSYDVNLYCVERLPEPSLRLRSRDLGSKAVDAFEAAAEAVRDGLKEKEIYVVRKRQGESVVYCEIRDPGRGGKRSYELVLSTHTCHGSWKIFLMDFDEQHPDCRRASSRRWGYFEDLKSHETALRFALRSLGSRVLKGRGTDEPRATV